MSAKARGVQFDAELGFHRLDPLPTEEELAAFYESQYYGDNGERRAPDLARLVALDEAGAAERQWRFEAAYPDLMHYVAQLGVVSGSALDVGCGTGEFVDYLANVVPGTPWQAQGIELADDAVAFARSRGLQVDQTSVERLGDRFTGQFDLVTMFNVLEHLADPIDALNSCHRILRPGGVLVVQVPNDFSSLQLAVRAHLDVEPWWIAIPDHVNYFDYDSLSATLQRHGFGRQVRYGTFPMEFFLVSGLNYLADREQGSVAHRSRCEFELSISPELRRRLYEDLAAGGVGRNCVIIAARD
jgi:SAM-dependent methyltransferase